MTFALRWQSVVFCSTPGTKLYLALAGAVVAFEADDVDPGLEFGWSVWVVGHASMPNSSPHDGFMSGTLGR